MLNFVKKKKKKKRFSSLLALLNLRVLFQWPRDRAWMLSFRYQYFLQTSRDFHHEHNKFEFYLIVWRKFNFNGDSGCQSKRCKWKYHSYFFSILESVFGGKFFSVRVNIQFHIHCRQNFGFWISVSKGKIQNFGGK